MQRIGVPTLFEKAFTHCYTVRYLPMSDVWIGITSSYAGMQVVLKLPTYPHRLKCIHREAEFYYYLIELGNRK